MPGFRTSRASDGESGGNDLMLLNPRDAKIISRRLGGFLYQLFQYFWVALIGLGVDFGALFVLTTGFGVNYLVSACTGFALGLVVNFVLSEKFVFALPTIQSRAGRFGIYTLIGIGGLLLLELLMWVQVELLSIPYLAAKATATVLVYAWNFLARRKMYRA